MIDNPQSGSSIPCKAVPLFAAVRRTICNQEKVSFLLPSLLFPTILPIASLALHSGV